MKAENRREEAIQELRRWLEGFGWSWYATLAIASGRPSPRRAKDLCDQWISEVQEAEGGPDFRWFRALERGALGTNPHCHVLVGGLRDRRRY